MTERRRQRSVHASSTGRKRAHAQPRGGRGPGHPGAAAGGDPGAMAAHECQPHGPGPVAVPAGTQLGAPAGHRQAWPGRAGAGHPRCRANAPGRHRRGPHQRRGGHPGGPVRGLLRRPDRVHHHAHPRCAPGVPGTAAGHPRGGHAGARPDDSGDGPGCHLHPRHGPRGPERHARPAQPGVRRRGPRAGLLRPADHLPAHPAQPGRGHRGPVEHRPGIRDPATSRLSASSASASSRPIRTGARCSPTGGPTCSRTRCRPCPPVSPSCSRSSPSTSLAMGFERSSIRRSASDDRPGGHAC